MKFKKQIILLSISIMILLASLMMSVSYSFDGNYLGSSIGVILPPVNHFGQKITQITPFETGYTHNMKDRWSSARTPSFIWSVTTGYGKLFGKHYCGIEGMFHRARHRMHSTISTQRASLHTHDELNVRMRDVELSVHYRQGYALSDTCMVFAKVGVSRNKVKMYLISHSAMIYPERNLTYNFPGYVIKQKTIYPIKIALELEKKLWGNIAVTCAYTYDRHGRIKLKSTQTLTTEVAQIKKIHDHTITMQSSAIMFGLKRYW